MKKLFLTLSAAIAVTFAANAQTEKGKFILGGNVSYNYDENLDNDGNRQGFSVAPNLGIFLADNIAVGLGIGYQWNQNDNSADKFKTDLFFVSPYARVYQGNGDLKFFGQLSVPMGWGTSKTNDTKTASNETYGVELSPGLAYFPTSKIGIEFSVRGLYYQNSIWKPEAGDNISTNSFGLNVNSLAPSLGVRFHF